MANLLYYFPCVDSTAPRLAAAINDCGLAPVFGSAHHTANKVMAHGPDDGSGAILSLHVYHEDLGAKQADALMQADRQTWKPCDEGKFWIGWQTAAPPRPEDLARKEQIIGHVVELSDGNNYMIPLARYINGGSEFPKRLTLGAGGKWIEELVSEYVDFCARAESVWRGVFGAVAGTNGATEIAAETGVDDTAYAIEALALNYHVGPWEVSALGLLTTKNRSRISLATVDWPTIEAHIKATAAEAKKKADLIPA